MAELDLTGLRPWLDAVTARHGVVIREIRLAGSRSDGSHREDSDWDVLIVLHPVLYAAEAAAIQAEQAIVTDPALPSPPQPVDVFYLLPDGRLRRWERCEHCGPAHVAHGWAGRVARPVGGLFEGPSGDFTRFFDDWPDPPVIWAPDPSQWPRD
jgi:hypothetical protein